MSFSYNESLVLEVNPMIENLLSQIEEKRIVEKIKQVALESITLDELKTEFKGFEVEGEHIKNYFIIALDGIQTVWRKMVAEEELLVSCQDEPLYENVFAYLDNLVDEIDFHSMFQKELMVLNK